MATKIQLRRDTEGNWINNNPVLAEGEIGINTSGGLFKIGNGVDSWNNLKYVTVPMGTSGSGGLSVGHYSVSTDNGISVGYSATSAHNSISVGVGAKSSGTGINIGNEVNTATDGVIQIGSYSHSTLKIPAVSGSTDGMTLKVNKDGTIYAE